MGKRWKYGPVEMLQPWSCDRCSANALLPCLSCDDSLTCGKKTAQMHKELSPQCHAQFGGSGIRFGQWSEVNPRKKQRKRAAVVEAAAFSKTKQF